MAQKLLHSMLRTLPISSSLNSTPTRCKTSCEVRVSKMDEKDRYDAGMAKRRKVLGIAWVDRANAKKTPFNSEFQDFITRGAWGEIWTRPHYDERTRRVLVLGTMIALGQWDEFRLHVRAALRSEEHTSELQSHSDLVCRL